MRTMKTLLTVLSAATLLAGICLADPSSTKFVRVPIQVTLDTNGSTLDFPKAKDGRQSFSVTWVSGKSRETLAVMEKGFFKKDGWFVYIESPTRIWTFDGDRQLDLVSRGGAHKGRYSVASKGVFETCPPAVWDAVPELVRKVLHNNREG
jgi:hypothetical protein